MNRVFIALDISEDARSIAARHVAALRTIVPSDAATWMRPEKLHLTMRFVGDCDPAMLDRISEISARCAGETRRFPLSLSETGVFPNSRKPRTLWIGIRDHDGVLTTLESSLHSHHAQSGLPGKRGNFTPHLTIGRVKDMRRCRPAVEQHLNCEITPVVFVAAGLTVYESTLLPTGSVYSVLSKYPFRQI